MHGSSDDWNKLKHLVDLSAENARLKAEVERLRKLFADTERLMLLDGEYEAAKVGTYARLKAEVEHWQEQWHFVIQDNNKQMDEIAALKAEVKRLDAMANECEHLHKGIYSLSLNVVQLKDDVERLRKAGDDVCESPYLWENDPAVIAWRAAKEGKPSV